MQTLRRYIFVLVGAVSGLTLPLVPIIAIESFGVPYNIATIVEKGAWLCYPGLFFGAYVGRRIADVTGRD